MIVHQVMSAARNGYKTIHIVCDDALCVCIIETFLQNTEHYHALTYLWCQQVISLGMWLALVGK